MKYRRGEYSAWAHGTKVDQDGNKVRCNYCSKVVPGITRLKQHLAKIGGNVTACPSVPESVRHEFSKFFQEHPYSRVVKPNKNQNIGEDSSAGGQSSHQQTSRYAQTEDGGSHHNVALRLQSIVDLDPGRTTDIGVSIKAKREEIHQMVANKLFERKMKKKHVDGGSSTADVVWGEQTSGLILRNPTGYPAGKSTPPPEPIPGIQPTDNLAFMTTNSAIETGRSICNDFPIPADRRLFDRQDRTSCSDQLAGHHIDQTIICAAATAQKAKSNEAPINEAKTAQKNLCLIERAFKGYKDKVKAEREEFRKIQEMTNQQLKEKVQEVKAKKGELGSLRVALDAKEKKLESFRAALKSKERELAAKDDEMEMLRRGALAAQAEWYMEGRDEIIIKAKKIGFNHKLLLPDPGDDPTE